jgi:flagellin
MPQVINTNMMSLNSQRQLDRSQQSLAQSVERLSSGFRINRAKDDAAGMAISERTTAQIRGLDQAIRNSNDGISMLQTTEGAMDEISNALQRMRELAVQAATGTVSSATGAGGTMSDKGKLNLEYQALASEINRVIDTTTFNGTQVLTSTSGLNIQVGYRNDANDRISISFTDLSDTTSGLTLYTTPGDITTAANARTALGEIDGDLDILTTERARIGATQNRLESTVRNLANVVENQSAARSRVRDADFAVETANLARTQILQQAGVSMLAQANVLPQNVLRLLGG